MVYLSDGLLANENYSNVTQAKVGANSCSPLISVVMTVFNAEKYLRAAIESVLSQTLTDFEFIIINDASTDGTKKIIQSYHDPRIVYVEHSVNYGASRIGTSVNEGIKKARGLYIARMDGDDICLPERFAEQAAYLEAHPDCAAVATTAEPIDNQDQVINYYPIFHKLTSAEDIKEQLIISNCLVQSSMMLRRSVCCQFAYPLATRAEDYTLWLTLVSNGMKIEKIDRDLIKYRVHADSVSYQAAAEDH